jgi:hypothetical protein
VDVGDDGDPGVPPSPSPLIPINKGLSYKHPKGYPKPSQAPGVHP